MVAGVPLPTAGVLLLLLLSLPCAPGQEAISVGFVNSGDAALAIHWTRPDGGLAAGLAVRPGAEVRQRTYAGHVWAVLKEGGGETPLRVVPIEQKHGVAQTVDVATGAVKAEAPPLTTDGYVPKAAAAAPAGGGGGGDILGLWRKVQQRTEQFAKEFESAAASCSAPSWPPLRGSDTLSDAVRRDAGSPIATRCAGAGLTEHLAARGCPEAPAWLSRAGLLRGYHVVCAQRQPLTDELREAAAREPEPPSSVLGAVAQVVSGALGVGSDGAGGADDGLSLTVVPGGSAESSVARSALLSARGIDMAALRLRLEELAFVYKSDETLATWDDMWTPQPWRLFTMDGCAVDSIEEVAAHGGLFLMFEGGQFIWPGIEKGYRRELKIYDRELTIETLELVSKNDEFCIKNEELCIENEELCINNEEFYVKNDGFCRSR